MALNLYRRHRRNCKAEREHNSRSGEFEERQKGWKRCDCPIFASGALSRRFRRQSTERITWDDAKIVAAAWEAAGTWNGQTVPSVVAPEPESQSTR